MEERLNKWLSRMGVCSRREADRLISEGKVLVDGKTAQMGQRIEDGQKVICDGKSVGDADGGRGEVKPPRPVLLAVNKPRGIVCTTSDKDRAENIVEMLSYPERIYPVGRLDKESEGLILMTNQGDLVNKIMRSTNAHEKEYIVTVDKVLTDEFIKQMSEGVWLEELERKTLPCKVRKQGERRFSIILTQGLNRQMHLLRRVRIMNIQLGGLKTGEYRKITGEEYKRLIKLLEGSTSLSKSDRRGKRYVAFHSKNENQVNKWKQKSGE